MPQATPILSPLHNVSLGDLADHHGLEPVSAKEAVVVPSPIPTGTNYPETPESVALALLVVTVNKAPELEALRSRFDALTQELIVVAHLLPPPIQEPPPLLQETLPEASPAENEALRVECEAIAAEYRAPLPTGDAGLIAALQRREDMAPRMYFTARGFNVTFSNEKEIAKATAYAAQDELERYIEETPAEGLPGVLVKLRWLILFNERVDDIDLEQLAEVIAACAGVASPQDGGSAPAGRHAGT